MTALEELVQAGGDIHRYFTDAEIESYRAYVRPLIIRGWVDHALTLIEFGLVLGLGWNRWLVERCRRLATSLRARVAPGLAQRLMLVLDRVWKGPGWGAAALFVLIYFAFNMAIDLPAVLYFDWYRERSMGLTNQSLPSFAGDFAKGATANAIGLLALGLGLYALMRQLPRRWWLALGVACVLGVLVSGFVDTYRSKLLFETRPLEAGPVRSAVEAVVARAQIPVKDVVIINSSRATNTANAYVAGQGPTREIVIYDTMLTDFTPAEIGVAVAHELGHLRESVWSRKLISAFLMVPLLYLFHLALTWGGRTKRLGFDSADDIGGLPLLFVLWFVLTFIAAPFSAGSQRQREADADAVALELTHDPGSFSTLMVKLAKQNKADPIPSEWHEIWMSHPSVARRLAMAARYETAHLGDLSSLP